jgi:transcriptional regulator with XRE-family HTH domain
MKVDSNKIRKRRLELKLSQESLAFDIDTSSSIIWRIENDVTKNPRFKTIAKIAEALEVAVEDLILKE